MYGKRGVDAVVATVLIIMITVAAVAIIWSTVIPMIKDAANSATAEKVSLAIETSGGYTVYDNITKLAKVQVTRGAEDSLDYDYIQINFVIDGQSYSYILPAPKKGTTLTYDVRSPKGKPDKIEIAPVISNSLKNVSGEVVFELSESIPEAAQPIVPLPGVVPPAPEEYARAVHFVKLTGTQDVDCISPSVCIARGSGGPLYNSLEESSQDYYWGGSPKKTLWAYGSCSDWKTLNFQSFYNTIGGGFGYNVAGNHFCLKLTEEKEYYDIAFESWLPGKSCGIRPTFSYNRTDNLTGQKIVFSSSAANNNSDCISSSVCITRGTGGPIYNYLNESYSAYWGDSPKKTLWAYGNCSQLSLSFSSFGNVVSIPPLHSIGTDYCMKLTEENKYYTVRFTGWQTGREACAYPEFSYTRTFYGKEGEI